MGHSVGLDAPAHVASPLSQIHNSHPECGGSFKGTDNTFFRKING